MKDIVCLSLFLALLVGILLPSTGSAQVGCDDVTNALARLCAQYVLKEGPQLGPSADCCSLVREVYIPCIYGHATEEVAKLISMEKVFYVAGACGRRIPAMKKCGSIPIGPGYTEKITKNI
ncbi:hypothetical protein MKX01_038671 [Papaver californicum]|nr:hypothetical protein MKX01_038671 [Papaver californicum]